VISDIIPGWEHVGSKRGRHEFERAVFLAKQHGAVIVAESVNRFRRPFDPDYKGRKQELPLSLFDLKRLMVEAEGVPLVTIVPPDTSPSEVRSYQTRRGQAGKDCFGGRPQKRFPKKATRLELTPAAIQLWNAGFSYRKIGQKLGVHFSTVRDWLKCWQKSAHLSGELFYTGKPLK
jgi:hypothetical protein